jgi:ABC-type multidrug transport system fused ATPase/permease subunit
MPVSKWPFPLFGSPAALATFFAASPGLMLSGLVLAVCSGLLAPASALATGALVDAVGTGGLTSLPLIAVGVAFALQRTLDPIREELGRVLWPRVDEYLNDRIMVAVSAPAGLQELEDPAVLDRIAQARGAVSGFSAGQAAEQFASLLVWRIQALASLAIIARWYWWAALILMAVFALSFNASRWHYQEITQLVFGRTDRMRRAYYMRTLALSSRMAKETRIYDLADWLVQNYRASSLAVLTDVWSKRNEGWLLALGLFLLIAGVEAVTLGVAVRDAIVGVVSLGTAVTVAQAVLGAGLLSRYEDLDWASGEAAAAADKVAELEATSRASNSVAGGARSAEGLPRHSIRFENVSFTYPGRAEPILDAFNLDIEVGRSLAIVGENGSGKTTLVKLLTRLYDPTGGRVTVDGIDLREIAPASWHGRISALFQDFARFEMAAYDNGAFGALDARDDAAGVTRAAANAGVLEAIERLEQGWATTLSREYRQGAELSGGEWQRLALARALFGVASGAGVLVLDEPTASLDVRGEAEIYQRFLELTRGVTTIVISHRFSTVQRADRIVVVEGGRVVEDGTHDELVTRIDGRYARMYALQASRFTDAAEPEENDPLREPRGALREP